MACILYPYTPWTPAIQGRTLHFMTALRASLICRGLPLATRVLPCTLGTWNTSPTTRLHRSHLCSATMVETLPPALEGLEPATLWRFFAQLSEIPRPSKHEEKCVGWGCCGWDR